jgi:outer membrane protein assembly factor BamB
LPLFAFKPTHTGTLPESDIVWKFNEAPPNVPTTLVYNGLLYMLDGTKKVMTCADPKTGEKKWQGNLPVTSSLSGSPSGADGKIYCISEAGDVLVLSAGPEFKVLNNVALEAPQSFASIAIAHKQVFVRAGATLYCFAKP